MITKPIMTLENEHRYQSVNGYYYPGPPEYVPVLAIEYGKNPQGQTIPFCVQTPRNYWVVEWCQRDETCYYHNTGSGLWLPWREYNGGFCTFFLGDGKGRRRRTKFRGQKVEFFGTTTFNPGRMCDPKAGVPIWWDRRHVAIATEKDKPVKDPEKYLPSCGYQALAEPLELEPGIINPFETDGFTSFGDTPCHYCNICDDWLPSNSDVLCDHLWWCETCGWWGGPGAVEGDGCKGNCQEEETELVPGKEEEDGRE